MSRQLKKDEKKNAADVDLQFFEFKLDLMLCDPGKKERGKVKNSNKIGKDQNTLTHAFFVSLV